MKPTKIISLTLALAMLSAGSFAQLRYGVRGEVSLNNPSFHSADLDIQLKQAPVLLFGVGGELGLPVNNLSVEGAMLYGYENVSLKGEGIIRDLLLLTSTSVTHLFFNFLIIFILRNSFSLFG